MSNPIPSWRRRKEVVGELGADDIERGVLLGTMLLALTGSFDDHDRKRGSVISLRTNVNKVNRRTTKGNVPLAEKLASMTITSWENVFNEGAAKPYSTALLMSAVWYKYRNVLAKLYGENMERHIDSIESKLHDIHDEAYANVEISTAQVAEDIVQSVNKTIYDRRNG